MVELSTSRMVYELLKRLNAGSYEALKVQWDDLATAIEQESKDLHYKLHPELTGEQNEPRITQRKTV